MSKTYTWIFIFLVLLLVVGVDAYLYCDDVPGNSISQVIIAAAEVSMLVPAFIGFVMGALLMHWFDNYKQGD